MKAWAHWRESGRLLGNWTVTGVQHGSPTVSLVNSESCRLVKWMGKMGGKLAGLTGL